MSTQIELLDQIDALIQNAVDLRKRCMAEFSLKELRDPHGAAKIIVPLVADIHDLTAEDLLSSGRSTKYAAARQFAMWALRKATMLSYPQIAVALNRRDHTTALYAFEKIEARRKHDGPYQRKTDAMLKLCVDALDRARPEVA